MNPKHMTNDSDRVAPDRRIHLPTPTPVRPRRRIAAGVLSLLLGLSCFAASPAWAVKLGSGANDTYTVPEFADVRAYLAASVEDRDGYIDVKIKHSSSGTEYTYTLKRRHLDAFHKDYTLTDEKLIKRYRNAADYNADPTRANRLYAYLENKDKVYRVNDLEIRNRDPSTLNDRNLPDPVEETPGNNTAIGVDASATEYRAIAIGHNASATNRGAIAIGHLSQSSGWKSIAIGSEANASGGIAMGRNARSRGHGIALGRYADSDGGVSLGNRATTGQFATALGGYSRATAAGGVAVGVGARAEGLNSIALGRGASVTGTRGIAIGSGVSAVQNEVVIGGAKGQHTYKLPGLVKTTHTSGTRVVTVDSQGRLSTQAATSSPASPSRGASLRGGAVLSSEVTPLNRDLGTRTDAADYEKAPAIGSGPEAPETAEQRRVVVQDTNRDGSVRLRTLDFGDLTGVDRRLAGVEQRVTSLSDRLNKATAMSAALSALPNVVPGDNRFFLGVGAGHYSSEQALAIGMSARVGRHVFVNAGAALASGDDASVRGGVGVVW